MAPAGPSPWPCSPWQDSQLVVNTSLPWVAASAPRGLVFPAYLAGTESIAGVSAPPPHAARIIAPKTRIRKSGRIICDLKFCSNDLSYTGRVINETARGNNSNRHTFCLGM